MANPSSFIDVHVFDGSWSHDITTKLSNIEKYTLFDWLICCLKSRGVSCDSDTIKGIKLVYENIQQHPNFDPRNSVYADDILSEICVRLVKIPESERGDTFDNISEQMADMYKLGQCPQGRTTRLIQIYNYLC